MNEELLEKAVDRILSERSGKKVTVKLNGNGQKEEGGNSEDTTERTPRKKETYKNRKRGQVRPIPQPTVNQSH